MNNKKMKCIKISTADTVSKIEYILGTILQISIYFITIIYAHYVYNEDFIPIHILTHMYNNISIFLIIGEFCIKYVGEVM